jgi:hypothetical protein
MPDAAEWMMPLSFNGRTYHLQVTLEEKTTEAITLRVHGRRGPLLLQYRFAAPNSKYGTPANWVLLKGKIDIKDQKQERLFSKALLLQLKLLIDAAFPPEGENTVPGTSVKPDL